MRKVLVLCFLVLLTITLRSFALEESTPTPMPEVTEEPVDIFNVLVRGGDENWSSVIFSDFKIDGAVWGYEYNDGEVKFLQGAETGLTETEVSEFLVEFLSFERVDLYEMDPTEYANLPEPPGLGYSIGVVYSDGSWWVITMISESEDYYWITLLLWDGSQQFLGIPIEDGLRFIEFVDELNTEDSTGEPADV